MSVMEFMFAMAFGGMLLRVSDWVCDQILALRNFGGDR